LVTSNRFPYIEVEFRVRGFQKKDWAYIDTGFDGFLIVPYTVAIALGDADLVSTWELGDGSLVEGADYLGDIEITGLAQTIRGQVTCLGDESILGLGVLKYFKTIFDHGRTVVVDA
jgi:predicted aspartyl protease